WGGPFDQSKTNNSVVGSIRKLLLETLPLDRTSDLASIPSLCDQLSARERPCGAKTFFQSGTFLLDAAQSPVPFSPAVELRRSGTFDVYWQVLPVCWKNGCHSFRQIHGAAEDVWKVERNQPADCRRAR